MILKRSAWFLVACLLIQVSTLVFAEDTPPPSPPSGTQAPQTLPDTISKEVWLNNLKMVAPNMICKNFSQDSEIGKVMQDKKMTVDLCGTLITPITEKCISQFQKEIPDTVNEEIASNWGRKIGECIGADFAMNHLYNTDTTGTAPTQQTSAPTSDMTDKNMPAVAQ